MGQRGEKLAGAIAVRFTLKPGERRIVPMVIAWDFPVVEFGQGRRWNRRYTDFYGTNGNNAWAIATRWTVAMRPRGATPSMPGKRLTSTMNPSHFGIAACSSTSFIRSRTEERFGDARLGRIKKYRPRSRSWSVSITPTTGPSMFVSMRSLPLLKFWPDIDKQVLREFAYTVPK